MNKKSFFTVMSCVVLSALWLAGCNSKQEEKKEEKVLKVQFVPTNNDGSMEGKTKEFSTYLKDKLGREVEVTLATDYNTIVEAMASGTVDIGIMPPAAYVQARERGGAKAILSSQLGAYNRSTGLSEEGKLSDTFKGEILVKANSDIKSLADLKGKKIATLSPSSASGYIYPVVEIKELGLDINSDLTLTTVNDIPSAMTAVLNGQQDACFVFEGARNVFANAFKDQDIMKELSVLYLTNGDIPNDAIAVQPNMDEALKDKIKQVFLEMPKDEKGLAAMSTWSHKGYVEADDKKYDTIKEYISKAAE